eukprot:CAMPEP_0118645792 /NCGR_PEP_ID=MMETSP0785-20121206/7696_1 /TAXON_ID=91992 /ORGANISM="Bolidomonas pacifica, Strain CCMP 1866" /LENGTH=378 /DNA_ID=CAMNT_0006537711 /DNA_START=243 /DNA_END=1379 /DNA_ORIENTATION=-
MIQGTDSGFCDYRYHPMYYAENKDPNAWYADGKADYYITESKKMWMSGTEGPCIDGDGPSCLNYCGEYMFGYPESTDKNDGNLKFQNYYVPCVPRDQSLPKDRNFPDGRFHHHTPWKKDRWVKDFIDFYIYEKPWGRKAVEENFAQEAPEHDEYGRKELQVRTDVFYLNPPCENAYKAYFCWINFPRCDTNTNQSLPMCRSACENMFFACGYPEEMWRCGEAQYFNDQIEQGKKVGEPELSTKNIERGMDERKQKIGSKNLYQKKIEELGYHPAYVENSNGGVNKYTYTSNSDQDKNSYFTGGGIHPGYVEEEDTYHRDFFPGQPFKDQQCDGYDGDGNCNDLPTCTPGFKGSGSSQNAMLALSLSFFFVLIGNIIID